MDFWLEYKFKDKFEVYESSASYFLKSTIFEQALEEALEFFQRFFLFSIFGNRFSKISNDRWNITKSKNTKSKN